MLGWYNNCSSGLWIGLRRQRRCYLSFNSLWQLFLTTLSICRRHRQRSLSPERTTPFVPLCCLVLMLVIARVDRNRCDSAIARKNSLHSEMDRGLSKEAIAITGHNLFLFEKGK